jgi:hypothetical protein
MGVESDFEVAEVVFENYSHWKCYKSTVFVFDDEKTNPLAPISIVSKTGFQFDCRNTFSNNALKLL